MKRNIIHIFCSLIALVLIASFSGCRPEDAETTGGSDGTSAGTDAEGTAAQAFIPEHWNGADIISPGVESITLKDNSSGASVSVTDPADQLLSCISSLNAGPAFSSKGIYGSRYTVTVSLSDGDDVSFTLTSDGVVITGDIFETQNGHEYRTAYKAMDTENYVSLLLELEKCFK